MRLSKVAITGYRSVSKTVVLVLDPAVTVLLGANDHGKTNLLDAITLLNADALLEEERDLNWDLDDGEKYPSIQYHFDLDETDRQELREVAQEMLDAGPVSATSGTTANASDDRRPPGASDGAASAAEPARGATLAITEVPSTVVVFTVGVRKKIVAQRGEGLPDGAVTKFMKRNQPRVELIRARDTVPDSTTLAALKTDEHEFMRGIFYYAGLDESEFEGLFAQTDSTLMRLERASEALNATLRANWTQGSDLSFRLVHDSKTDTIALRIKDPAVSDRLVRASQRSSGFTHFFTLKTVLHARQREHPADSYIFLFDEPGIYLHPAGQHDLLQVLDTIGQQNQVVYSTHSLFMLHKTFPARHRLVVKTANGTKIDGKPYASRWGAALEALGLSLAGTILFAQYILLTEGDSDPLYIPAVVQKLVALGQSDLDLNVFCAVSTETSRNTDALIRMLSEGNPRPRLAVLFDGDDGGRARQKLVGALIKKHDVGAKQLLDGTTIEDHLPLVGELYVRAVADYVAKVMETRDAAPEDIDKHRDAFRASFRESFEEGKVTKGVAQWAATAGKKLGNLEQEPSKVGIAREYIRLLEETSPEKFTAQSLQRPLKLLEALKDILPIPAVKAASNEVLRPE